MAAARGVMHVLPAPASRTGSPVDFRDTARLIDEGYQLAADWLARRPAGAVLQPDRASPEVTARHVARAV